MAIKLADLILNMYVDGSKVKAQVDDTLNVAKTSVERASPKIASSAEKAGQEAGKKFSEGFGGLARELLPTVGISAITSLGMGFASFREQAKLTFEVLLKDGKKAQDMFQFIYEYAAKTPFEMKGLMNASLMLQAFGLNVQHWLPLIGDWASAMQAAGVSVERIAEALSYAATGRFAIALRSLATVGISQMELMKKGLKFSEANEYLGTYEEFFRTLEELIKEKFGGMAEKQAKTFAGLMSTVKDEIQMLLGETFTDLMEGLKEVLAGFNSLSSEAKQTIINLLISLGSALSIAFGGPLAKILGALMLIYEFIQFIKNALGTKETGIASTVAEMSSQMGLSEKEAASILLGFAGTQEEIDQAYSVWKQATFPGMGGLKRLEGTNLGIADEAKDTKEQLDALFNDPDLANFFDSIHQATEDVGTGNKALSETKEELSAIEKLTLSINEGWTPQTATEENLMALKEMSAEYSQINERIKQNWYWEQKAQEAREKQLELLKQLNEEMAVSAPSGGIYGSLGDLVGSITDKLKALIEAMKSGAPYVAPQWNKAQALFIEWFQGGGFGGARTASDLEQALIAVFDEGNRRLYETLGLGLPWEEFKKLPGDLQNVVLQIAEYQALQQEAERLRKEYLDKQVQTANTFQAAVNQFTVSVQTFYYYLRYWTGQASGGGGPPAKAYQRGGLVLQPTMAWVGEREPEYIFPARKMEGLMEAILASLERRDLKLDQKLSVSVEVQNDVGLELATKGVSIA